MKTRKTNKQKKPAAKSKNRRRPMPMLPAMRKPDQQPQTRRKTTRGDDHDEDELQPSDYEYYEDYADERESQTKKGEKDKRKENKRVTASLAGWRSALLRNRYALVPGPPAPRSHGGKSSKL